MITATAPKTIVAGTLSRAAEYIKREMTFPTDSTCVDMGPRTYNDRKASQLLEALADLLIAQARIESWFVDLGFEGCQEDACLSESAS